MEKFAKEKLSQESYQIFFGILLGVITGICLFLPNFFADEIYSCYFLSPLPWSCLAKTSSIISTVSPSAN